MAQNTATDIGTNGAAAFDAAILIEGDIGYERDTPSLRVGDGKTVGGVKFLPFTKDAARTRSDIAEAFAMVMTLTPRPQLRPTRAFTKAFLSGAVTIVLVGDSITEGADLYYPNSWAHHVPVMLQFRFPWVSWNVVNLGLGGRGAVNLADPNFNAPFPGNPLVQGNDRTLNNEYFPRVVNGKSWRDHVRDEAPDMVIYAFGMNDGEDEAGFAANFQSFYDYSQTWTKKPWFTLNSCFLPTVLHDDIVPVSLQRGQQTISDFVKHSANVLGFPLIDPNSLFRMSREGVRREFVPFTTENDFRYWGDINYWNPRGATSTLAGNKLTTNGLNSRTIRARDVEISAKCNVLAASVFRVNYRMNSDTVDLSGFEFQLDTAGVCSLYYRNQIVANVGIPAKTAGQSYTVHVSAAGPNHYIWVDGVVRVAYRDARGMIAGSVWLGSASGTVEIEGPRISYAPEAAVAPPFYDEAALFGTPVYGDIKTNPDSTEGDSIHHPSRFGSFNYYIPAVAIWVRELGEALGRATVLTQGLLNSAKSSPVGGVVDGVAFADMTVTAVVGRETDVIANIMLSYQNSGAADGVLQVLIGGQVAAAWYLPTTGASNFRAVNFSIPLLLGAGTNVVSLAWGGLAAGAAAMTTGGGARSLALNINPS